LKNRNKGGIALLIDNRILLKQLNPKTYHEICEVENQESSVEVFPSKKGAETLSISIGGKQYLYHSKYDPMRESQSFMEKVLNVHNWEDIKHVLFIGIGLGYHIELLLEKFPNIAFSIYEPNAEVLNAFLSRVNLTRYKENRIKDIFTKAEQIYNLDNFLDVLVDHSIDLEFPISLQLNFEEIQSFRLYIKEQLKEKRFSLGTNAAFQQRWTINSIINFLEVLNTPNFFEDINSHLLQDKPVILAAAGPSLSLEIENLRKIKEEGRAYIFAVGSAVNALISENILPDAFFSYDPKQRNAKVSERIKEKNLDIPLIFGSSIGFEVLKNYPGRKIHFLTSQDTFSHYILGIDNRNTIPDAPSVAVLTLYILLKLKVRTIILVGQNLGFVNRKRFAKGIKYDHQKNELDEQEIKKLQLVESVDGGKIETDDSYLSMKQSLEIVIKTMNSNSEVINTTKNGAKINGTLFIPLEEVIEKKLQQTYITSDEWLQGERKVDLELVRNKFRLLENSFDEMVSALKEVLRIQEEIIQDYEKGIYTKLESQLVRFDRAFNRVKNAEFFNVIIKPITRVQHEEFVKRSHEVQVTHLPRQKVEKFINIFVKYTRAIYAAIIYIQPSFKQLKESGIFLYK
jgi:hypothetical protein